ncbi:MAG: tetratricopeptide repeat protein [Deltaproteobacteria bacterium]|nr:tetratricopeptide repeat protein [Deltaproteobacteria bacterium]
MDGRALFLLLGVGCAAPVAPPLAVQADALYRQGKVAESYAAYGRALCAAPGDLSVARRYIDLWQQLGATGSFLAPISGCARGAPTEAYLSGLAAAVQGKHEVAAERLEFALATVAPEGRAEVAYRLGLVRLAARDWPRAVEVLERASGLAPTRVDARLALAQAQLEQGRFADSIQILRGIMAITPDQDELRHARRQLQTAVARSEAPLAADVDQAVSEVLAALERGAATDDELEKIRTLAGEVEHPRVLTVAALAALKRGAQAEAARLLEQATAMGLLDPAPWRVLGSSLVATGRTREALRPLTEAFARDPFDVDVAAMLAATAAAVDENRVARDAYRALTLLQPEVAAHALGLARMERRLARPEAALTAVERGVELDPQSVPLLVELASIEAELASKGSTAAVRQQAKTRARAAVARLIRVAPNHPAAPVILKTLDGG